MLLVVITDLLCYYNTEQRRREFEEQPFQSQPEQLAQFGAAAQPKGDPMANRETYLAFIRAAYERENEQLEAEIARWQGQFRANAALNALLGYASPKWPLHLAVVAGFLYERDGDETLADRARDILLRYRTWTQLMPPDAAAARPEYAAGVPPLDCAFDPPLFAATAERIRGATTAEQRRALADLMADSLRPVWRFPEWGGHNRAMLRAASLACCARVFPEHVDAPAWRAMADELAEESWGRWSIEDAMMYQATWLRALILYAEATDRAGELAQQIPVRLHLRAMPQLMSPLGVLPDFGDSRWLTHSPWEGLACLEWGAAACGDETMKGAARRIWEEWQEHGTPHIDAAHVLTFAWRWCDDARSAHAPSAAADALDDLVSKKIVTRTGWDGAAAYACLNYRDEGDYGRIARDYLRTNLAVSAEKMHHGHADEGSISLLIYDRTILLHESGYRELPPDGMYRADFYHNRLIWRPGILGGRGDPSGGASEVTPRDLMDNGHYKPTRTERLYQTRLGDAELSRVRVTDEREGIAWERTIFFLPALPCWVVIDAARALRAGPRTFGLLWWTTDVLAHGPGWADTHIGRIQGYENAANACLRILTPAIPGQTIGQTSARLRRAFQEEMCLAGIWRGHHEAGRTVNFVTVLWPRPYPSSRDADLAAAPQLRAEVLASDPFGRGLAVKQTWQDETRLLVALNDLTAAWLQEEVRPRYTFAQGRTTYGPLTTDAAFACVKVTAGKRWAGFINGTRLDYAGETLHAAPQHAMFQEDRTDRPGAPARFRWESDQPSAL
jgi:hypothetical protein